MVSLALLLLRLTFGGLIAGHGAQKFFGWFGGPGMQGTSGMMESLQLQPPRPWAITAASSEFGGGVLMMLGLFNPLGPLGAIGAMSMATAKVHWGKPIWVTKGGAELPVTNMAIASALMLAGPGKLSLDAALGTKLSRWIIIPGLAAVAATLAMAQRRDQQEAQPPPPRESDEAAQQRRAEEAGVM